MSGKIKANVAFKRRRDNAAETTHRQLAATRVAHACARRHVDLGRKIHSLSLLEAVQELGPEIVSTRHSVSRDAVESRLYKHGTLVDDPSWQGVTKRQLSRATQDELNSISKQGAEQQKAKAGNRKAGEDARSDRRKQENNHILKSIVSDDDCVKKNKMRRRDILLAGMGGRACLHDTTQASSL